MVVSHLLVSWVQVLGLVVGLFGSFYLEIGLFGKKNMPWLSALLPAAASGLGLLLLYSSTVVGQFVNAVLRLGNRHPPQPTSLVWFAWFCGVGTLAYYYFFGALLAKRQASGDKYSTFWGRFKFYRRFKSLDPLANLYLDRKGAGVMVLVLAFGTIVIIGVTTFLYLNGADTSDRLNNALHIGGGIAVLYVGQMIMMASVQISDPEQLKKIGFILSALAILTQFVPPVLDLLNISVK